MRSKFKKYTIVTPRGAKVVLKARKLKKGSIRYEPARIGGRVGFQPICEHGVRTTREIER